MRRVVALALAAGLAAVAGCASGPPYRDERRVCTAVQHLVDARKMPDPGRERAALQELEQAARKAQNVNLARYGQSYTSVPGSAPEPTAFDRMVKECLRIGLPISGVRVPF